MTSDTVRGPAALNLSGLDGQVLQVVDGTAEVDYGVVRRLRRQVAEALAEQLVALRGRRQADVTPEDRAMLARTLIDEAVAEWVTQRVRDHEPAPTPAEEDATTAAVFAALFGLGRLQGWVSDPEVENIDVNGCDQVWISYAGGRLVRAPAVADSDGELIEIVQSFAAYLGQSAREFSSARPLLNLRLPDGSRLCAWMAVTPRPGLSIRRHRLTDIGLEELQTLGSIDAGLLAFLRAAVRARKNIVVTGGVNAGKTTLVRALANEFDPYERVVVVEKEYELALDRLPDRHHQVVCMESRDANAEGSGEVTLATLVVHALRMNPRRIICGEVRGDELIPMITAMGSGNDGSLCTLHANSAHAAFTRMSAIGLSSPEKLPPEATHLLAADAVDFVVHVQLVDDTARGGTRRRFVSTVLEVTGIGENGRVATNAVYRAGPDGRAVPGSAVACLDDLMRAGFDPGFLDAPTGWWEQPVTASSVGSSR